MGLSYTPIEIEWFYYLEGDKTKLNWFLLEIALEFYDHIRDSKELAAYREQYDDKQVAQFCTYYARRLKKSLINCLRGRTKSVIFYHEYVDDFYPHHDEELNGLLTDVAMEAYDHMQFGCKNCPQNCLHDYSARSPLFDEHQDEGK